MSRTPQLPPVYWRVVVSGRTGYQTTLGSRNYTTRRAAEGYANQQRRRGHTARIFWTPTTWAEVET